MRRFGLVSLAAAALLAGCGGSSSAKLADVRPCLSKLGLVVVATLPKVGPDGKPLTFTRPTLENVDIAYRHERVGANAVHLTFYDGSDDANSALVLARHNISLNPRINFGVRPTVVGRTVVSTWSSRPSKTQQSRLAACFD